MEQLILPSEPIPLAAPDGTVYAYACPRCLHVRQIGGRLVRLDEDLVVEMAESSKRQADSCCRCSRCGGELDAPVFADCPVCAPIEKAEQEERWRQAEERQARREAARADRLAAATDRDSACRLVAVMRDLSEEHWAAGWLNGLEFSLWRMTAEDDGSGLGMGEVPADQLAELRRLHDACGGWWHWDDGLCGEMFVPAEEWLKMYAAQKTEAS